MRKTRPRVIASTGLLLEDYTHLGKALKICPPGTTAASLIRLALMFALNIGVDVLAAAGFFEKGIDQDTVNNIRLALAGVKLTS